MFICVCSTEDNVYLCLQYGGQCLSVFVVRRTMFICVCSKEDNVYLCLQ